MIELLHQFQPFRDLPLDTLRLVERFCQLVHLPSGRRLDGRSELPGDYYLVRGRLRAQGVADLKARSARAEQAVLPGLRRVTTLTPVTLLRVDAQARGFLPDARDSAAGPLVDGEADDSGELWLERFIGSAVIAPLGPQGWQQVLRALSSDEVSAGQVLVRQGDAGDVFYVVERGRALVWQNGEQVADLGPGDFFGEDALISRRCRNATVIADSDLRVRSLAAPAFGGLLASLALREVAGAGGVELFVGDEPVEGLWLPLFSLRRHLDRLDPNQRYRVVANSARSARLAVFILRHRGFEAWVSREVAEGVGRDDQAGTVRSAAQARSASIESPRSTEIG